MRLPKALFLCGLVRQGNTRRGRTSARNGPTSHSPPLPLFTASGRVVVRGSLSLPVVQQGVTRHESDFHVNGIREPGIGYAPVLTWFIAP